MKNREHLLRIIQHHKLSHAYLFHGEAGAGKLETARWFAKALQCGAQGGEPCGTCRSCLQADGGNHPDILFLRPEKPATIGVDDIRDQVNNEMGIKPYSSAYKIFIIDGAERMTVQAQNALLKTLEEPPSYGILILLTENADIFLPTIRSRCVILNFDPAPEEERMRRNPEWQEMKEHCGGVLERIGSMSLEQVYDAGKEISQYKDQIDRYLDFMLQWYRDDLLRKERGEASHCSYRKISKNITAIEEARTRIRSNGNIDLALEMMLFAIKEKESSW